MFWKSVSMPRRTATVGERARAAVLAARWCVFFIALSSTLQRSEGKRHSYSATIVFPADEDSVSRCSSPLRQPGVCLPIEYCPQLRRVGLRRLPKYLCGFQNDTPLVCCTWPSRPGPTDDLRRPLPSRPSTSSAAGAAAAAAAAAETAAAAGPTPGDARPAYGGQRPWHAAPLLPPGFQRPPVLPPVSLKPPDVVGATSQGGRHELFLDSSNPPRPIPLICLPPTATAAAAGDDGDDSRWNPHKQRQQQQQQQQQQNRRRWKSCWYLALHRVDLPVEEETNVSDAASSTSSSSSISGGSGSAVASSAFAAGQRPHGSAAGLGGSGGNIDSPSVGGALGSDASKGEDQVDGGGSGGGSGPGADKAQTPNKLKRPNKTSVTSD